MSEFNVAVYREGRTFRVEPGRLLVRHGDTVTFWSVDAGDVTAFLPPPLGHELVALRPEGLTKRFRAFLVPELPPACYEYAVHVDDERVFAEGGSQPKIIVLE